MEQLEIDERDGRIYSIGKKKKKYDNPRVISYSSYPRNNRAKDLRGECSKKNWQRPNNLKHFEFDKRIRYKPEFENWK